MFFLALFFCHYFHFCTYNALLSNGCLQMTHQCWTFISSLWFAKVDLDNVYQSVITLTWQTHHCIVTGCSYVQKIGLRLILYACMEEFSFLFLHYFVCLFEREATAEHCHKKATDAVHMSCLAKDANLQQTKYLCLTFTSGQSHYYT